MGCKMGIGGRTLNLVPTYQQTKGQPLGRKSLPFAPLGGWFFGTEGIVESKVVEEHIGWILDRLDNKHEVISQLQREGCRVEISCYWASACGNGGPFLSATLLRRLAEFNIGIWFDFYFVD
jgi:hypothetical protein